MPRVQQQRRGASRPDSDEDSPNELSYIAGATKNGSRFTSGKSGKENKPAPFSLGADLGNSSDDDLGAEVDPAPKATVNKKKNAAARARAGVTSEAKAATKGKNKAAAGVKSMSQRLDSADEMEQEESLPSRAAPRKERTAHQDGAAAAKDKEIAALKKLVAQLQSERRGKDAAYAELAELRSTDAEAQLEALRELSDMKIATSRQALDQVNAELNYVRKELASSQAEAAAATNALAASQHQHPSDSRKRSRPSLSFASSDAVSRISALETEVDELRAELEQTKEAEASQRQKRKEWEREASRVRQEMEDTLAQDDTKEEVGRLEEEVKTLQKLLSTEETHSRELQVQLHKAKASSTLGTSVTASNALGSSLNRSAAASAAELADMNEKLRLSEELAGLTILKIGTDLKGTFYECLITDVLSRGLAVGCRLQRHSDGSWSYVPDFDPDRDERTIRHLPEFLHGHIRFPATQRGHFFTQLFKGLNLVDKDTRSG